MAVFEVCNFQTSTHLRTTFFYQRGSSILDTPSSFPMQRKNKVDCDSTYSTRKYPLGNQKISPCKRRNIDPNHQFLRCWDVCWLGGVDNKFTEQLCKCLLFKFQGHCLKELSRWSFQWPAWVALRACRACRVNVYGIYVQGGPPTIVINDKLLAPKVGWSSPGETNSFSDIYFTPFITIIGAHLVPTSTVKIQPSMGIICHTWILNSILLTSQKGGVNTVNTPLSSIIC